MALKIDFSELPRTSDLYRDYVSDFGKVERFFSTPPYDGERYEQLFKALQQRHYNRDLITNVLREQNRTFGNKGPTIASLDRFRHEDTFVIFTGQQAGLFGGPLYTLYKAMTAVNLARYLTMTTPYTFLPFFWVEGEDHDFEEIRSASIIDKNNEIKTFTYEPETPFAGQSAGSVVLDETVQQLINDYAESIIDTEFKPLVLDALRTCYRPGRTMTEAFACWMAYLLGPYGLILVDPSDPRLKELALPVYETSLEKQESAINPALESTDEALKKAGYHTQVAHRTDTLDFFCHEPRRLPLVRQNGGYRLKDTQREFSSEELAAYLKDHVDQFSPNVVLRPLVQDFVFPTAAYVAGPSEVAYFAQFRELYNIFDIPMPIIYPRKSLTLVETRVDKVMQKYRVTIHEIFRNRKDLEKRILMGMMPEDLVKVIKEANHGVMKHLDALEKAAVQLNPDLRGVIGKLKGRINKELSGTEARIMSEVEQKDHIIAEQIDKIYANLFPQGILQERFLNILSFLYKYHVKLIYNLMELTCCKHDKGHLVWRVEV